VARKEFQKLRLFRKVLLKNTDTTALLI
jgi:hypothetical protein